MWAQQVVGCLGCIGLLWGSVSAAPPLGPFSPAARHLQTLLHEGLTGRTSSRLLSHQAAATRPLWPNDPIVDYVHGLALLKRGQNAAAAKCFRSAVLVDVTSLPSWHALFRLRMCQGDVETLHTELQEFADAIADPQIPWANGQRQKGAELLSRVITFLAQPNVNLVPADDVTTWDAELSTRLGPALTAAYQAGKTTLLMDVQKLKAVIKDQQDATAALLDKQADEAQAELQDEKKEVQGKQETVHLTADQWKSWFSQQVVQSDRELANLQKDYATLDTAAQAVAAAATQTEYEMGRRQTQLQLSRVRIRSQQLDPVLIQLQQRLLEHQSRRLALDRQAAQVLGRARQVLAARAAAAQRYQTATGLLVRQDRALERWNKLLAKTNQKTTPEKKEAKLAAIEEQLSSPTSYFPIDYDAEKSRILKEYGLEQ